MMAPRDLPGKALRYLGRCIMLPHRVTETLLRVRQIDSRLQAAGTIPGAAPKSIAAPAPAPAGTATPAATPGEIYAGYEARDLRVFDFFADARPQAQPGFVTDFLGNRTRTSSLWDAVRCFDGQVMGRPVPHDLFEAIEWIGLLKAVAAARGGRFAMMQLGAGWGPWLVSGAGAAKLRGIRDLHLLGVEADPGRCELMRQHFIDNGLDPAAHSLICAAVGVEAGHDGSPRIADAPNARGARPVRETAAGPDEADTACMHGGMTDAIDVPIVSLKDLLAREAVWDLVHIDVRGSEARLCAGCIESLNVHARWLVISTHSRRLDAELISILHAAGWVLENEKPTRFRFDPSQSCMERMTVVDGAQVWRNPRLL